MTNWHLIKDEPAPNDVFDVIASYWDASLDMFLLQRFTSCIQVQGVIMWGNPFSVRFPTHPSEPISLVEYGFLPTHWAQIPDLPKMQIVQIVRGY